MVHTDYGRSKFHIRRFYARYVEYIQTVALFYIRKIHQIHGGFCYPQEFHGRRFPPPSWCSSSIFWTFFVWKKKCHHICGGFYGNWRGDSPLSLILGRKEEERKKDWLWWRRCFLFGWVEKWRGNGLHTDYGRSPLLSLSVFIPKKWKDGVTGVSCGYRFLCDMAFSVLFLALFLLFYAGRRGFFLSVRMWRQQGLTHRFG